MSNILPASDFDDTGSTTPEHDAAGKPIPAAPTIPPQVRFREVRDRLLFLEKADPSTRDLAEVQALVNEAADLIHTIQVSTTGPRKKVEPVDGTASPKKAKPAKKVTNIMPAEDF